jgi:hypothetical protein
MLGSPSLFGTDEADFDDRDAFVPAHLPDPGPFLTGSAGDDDREADGVVLLTGDAHVAVHEMTHEVFEERSVYDATFGYNLAKLNRDTRHPDAGFRYAEVSREGASVLRAEFTPTTEFCPQGDTLCVGAFRAWNGCRDRHEYPLVRVRAAPSHQRAGSINRRLRELELELEAAADAAVTPEPVPGVDDPLDGVEGADDLDGRDAGTDDRRSGGSLAPF